MERSFCYRVAAWLLALAAGCSDGSGPRREPPALTGTIVFNDRVNGVWDLYLVNADGTGRRRLTNTPEDDLYPAWSPDRRRIVFVSAQAASGIYVINSDGSGLRRVHGIEASSVNDVAWSPDGTRIAFEGTGPDGYDLFVMNSDGSGVRNITDSVEPEHAPAWSPDGRLIAFHSNGDVFVTRPDGSDVRNLTRNLGGDEVDPAWSPDGSTLAIARQAGGPVGIWLIHADGTNPRQLTAEFDAADRVPSWSPDGTRIVFQRARSTDPAELYVMNRDGSGLRRVASSGGHPSW